MNAMNDCHIHSFGTHVPARVLTNEDLCSIVDTTDEWISTRTGIKSRRILAEDQNISDVGLAAAVSALKDARVAPDEVTHVLTATCTPDYACPSLACLLAGRLGCGPIMALDFNAACSGFIYGLELARALLAAQPDAVILLVSAEALSRRVNWQDRSTCVLFGDGAGAMVLRNRAEGAIGRVSDVSCRSDGKLWELITIGGGTRRRYEPGQPVGDDYFVQMQGREVFRHAVRNMAAVCRDVMDRNGLSIGDIDVLVPHQANMRIIEAVGARLEIPTERVFVNVMDYGNTSSASVPLALAEALAKGSISGGDKVLVASFGGGLTWGAALLQF